MVEDSPAIKFSLLEAISYTCAPHYKVSQSMFLQNSKVSEQRDCFMVTLHQPQMNGHILPVSVHHFAPRVTE